MILLARLLLIEVLDHWEVLDGSYRGMAEGELEVSVAVLPLPVPAFACRVGRDDMRRGRAPYGRSSIPLANG